MLAAIKALRNEEVDRIILTRPAIGVEDEQHGFLPEILIKRWNRGQDHYLMYYVSTTQQRISPTC